MTLSAKNQRKGRKPLSDAAVLKHTCRAAQPATAYWRGAFATQCLWAPGKWFATIRGETYIVPTLSAFRRLQDALVCGEPVKAEKVNAILNASMYFWQLNFAVMRNKNVRALRRRYGLANVHEVHDEVFVTTPNMVAWHGAATGRAECESNNFEDVERRVVGLNPVLGMPYAAAADVLCDGEDQGERTVAKQILSGQPDDLTFIEDLERQGDRAPGMVGYCGTAKGSFVAPRGNSDNARKSC